MSGGSSIAAPLRIVRLEIKELRSIEEADINFRGRDGLPRMRTVILGENGAGKSTILRAIGLSLVPEQDAAFLAGHLSGDLIRVNTKGTRRAEAWIKLSLVAPEAPEVEHSVESVISRDASGKEALRQTTTPGFPWERIVAAGYGVNRGRRAGADVGSYEAKRALLSLFRDETELMDPEGILMRVALADLQAAEAGPETAGSGGGDPRASLSDAKRFLRTLLRLNSNHGIDVTAEAVRVHGPWGSQPFHALGDGYRGTAGWALDFMGRAWAAKQLSPKGPAGIVLLDEVDEHLHPAWSREILKLISKVMPGAQLIATTHSPVTIVPAEPEELVLIQIAYGKASVVCDLPDTKAHTIEQILRGQWFGLTKTMDDATEDLVSEYHNAVRSNRPIAERDRLRRALWRQAPGLVQTPIDELAMRAAAIVRSHAPAEADPAKLEQAAAAQLRLLLQRPEDPS